MGKGKKLTRTPESEALQKKMEERIYTERKTITVNGEPFEVDVKICPPFDPRAIAGYESGEDIAKIFNIRTNVGIKGAGTS